MADAQQPALVAYGFSPDPRGLRQIPSGSEVVHLSSESPLSLPGWSMGKGGRRSALLLLSQGSVTPRVTSDSRVSGSIVQGLLVSGQPH